MAILTLANQLTLGRLLLVPVIVILVVYGHSGWALITFALAGLTDALDGLTARWSGQRTSLGALLDPMADKLLLVSMFVVLTVPGLGFANQFPVWLTVLVISRDVIIVVTVAVVNLAVERFTFSPSIFGKVADVRLHRDRCDHALLQLPRPAVCRRRCGHLSISARQRRFWIATTSCTRRGR